VEEVLNCKVDTTNKYAFNLMNRWKRC